MTPRADITTLLAPHIHLAWCGPDVVILDVEADEYALLVDVADLIRPGVKPGSIVVSADAHADLAALGLLSSSLATDRRPLPAQSGEIPGAPAPGLASCLRAALDSLASTADFRRRSFRALVARAGGRPASKRRTPPDIAGAAAAFQAVHPFIPFEGDCLQRGYRLHHHLRRAGIEARWVFGVRTWPFLAHCWVQVGDQVVGDTLERVGGFTPILVV